MAALAAGGLIDRYGGRLVYTVGTTLLASGSLLLALGIVNADDPAPMLVLVRLLQGVGLAGVLPAVASLVPGMVSRARLPTALAFVGVAANVSMAVMPPISIAILNGASLQVLGGVMVAITALGLVLLAPIKRAERVAGNAAGGGRPRRFRPAWRPSWAAPIAITFLFVAHWGVVTGYLPQRAAAAGADVSLLFTGDAIALLAVRVPAAWLTGRIGVMPLVVGGVAVTSGALLLLLPPTTMLLILAGLGTGIGGGMILPAMMIELSHRSDDTDRGSAFGLLRLRSVPA